MKTAVEWLVEHLNLDETSPNYNELTINKAKKMEKEQIIEAYNKSFLLRDKPYSTAEKYYNETYKTKIIVTEFRDGSVKVETFKSE